MPLDIEQALTACCTTNGASGISQLQELIQPLLTERLTVVSTDPLTIREAIDGTFALFAKTVCDAKHMNWLAWIAATALSLIAERVGAVSWLDGWLDGVPGRSVQSKRALVLGVILSLDGKCQWILLQCICNRWQRLRARDCQVALKQKLSEVTGLSG
jgi:hypothetical protein